MAILVQHVPWYSELFEVEGVVAEPMLIFGHQAVRIPKVALFAPSRAPCSGS